VGAVRFSWNRGEDGVVTVYGTTSDGRVFDVADFWLNPMIERLGVSRAVALDYQQQHAELLVTAHNKLFTAADRREQEPRTDEEMKGGAPPARTNQPEVPSWECPIQNPECTTDCGSYGCGN
jgi:hypothetical protein